MKRSAEDTKRLAKALVNQGHNVTARMLERWSQQRLGPIGLLDFSELVRHYAEVDSISKRGREGDLVARRLAARGFASQRLRGAILREMGITPEPPSVMPRVIDLSDGPSGDAGFASLEQMAHDMLADTGWMPPLMAKVVKALYRNAAERAEQLGESADAIFHSFLVNVLFHLMGHDYYNTEALEAVIGVGQGSISVDELDAMNASKLRISIPTFEDAYRTVPVEDIAFIAHRLTTWVPHLLRYLKVTGVDQAEIEDVTVSLAPAAICFVNLLREAFDDFPDEPVPLAPHCPNFLQPHQIEGVGRGSRGRPGGGSAGTVSGGSRSRPGIVREPATALSVRSRASLPSGLPQPTRRQANPSR
jgi:hypothetical protein